MNEKKRKRIRIITEIGLHEKTISVVAKDAKTGKQIKLEYINKKITGNGSFGVVYQTRLVETKEDAAIKKVLQDRRFKVCLRF